MFTTLGSDPKWLFVSFLWTPSFYNFTKEIAIHLKKRCPQTYQNTLRTSNVWSIVRRLLNACCPKTEAEVPLQWSTYMHRSLGSSVIRPWALFCWIRLPEDSIQRKWWSQRSRSLLPLSGRPKRFLQIPSVLLFHLQWSDLPYLIKRSRYASYCPHSGSFRSDLCSPDFSEKRTRGISSTYGP